MAGTIPPTPDQERVIESRTPSLCVIACAGSGKTFTLTRRIARLIDRNIAKPENIVAITFTEMAAEELEYRLAEVLGDMSKFAGVFIGTIHAFGLHLLKEFKSEIGPEARILTDNQQFVVFRRFWDKWSVQDCAPHINHKPSLIDKVITSISILKMEDIPLEKISKKHPSLMILHSNYQKYLTMNYLLDFDDLIAKTYKMLIENPEILKTVRSRYMWYFIDEYQDVDPMQEKLLSTLAGGKSICVVGDDDQSIYQFRGTDVRNLINFKNQIPKSKVFYLSVNRRCRRNITKFSEIIVSKVKWRNRMRKQITSNRPGGLISVHKFNGIREETLFIADTIKTMQESQIISSIGQVAILLRSVTSSGQPYMDALEAVNITYISKGDRSLFEREPIPQVVNALEILAKDNDDPSTDTCVLNAIDQQNLVDSGFNLISRSSSELKSLGCGEAIIRKITGLASIRSKYRTGKYNHLCEIIYDIIAVLDCLKGNYDNTEAYNLARLTDVVLEYTDVEPQLDIRRLCAYIQAYAKRSFDQYTPEKIRYEAVNILTIHQAKGLEFDVVFCPMLVKGRFPSEVRRKRWLLDNKLFDASRYLGSLTDERRLFYVAVTRARERLYLTYSKDIGLKYKREPSIFFKEARKFRQLDKPVTTKSVRRLPQQYLVTSYSAIEYYLSCHFRYKLLRDIGFVTIPNPFFEYGRCMHTILNHIHSIVKEQHGIDEVTIKSIFDSYFQISPKIPKGVILTKRLKGLEVIKRYCKNKIDWLMSTVSTEIPFSYYQTNALIKGRIDLIISEHDDYVLIDFKTGLPREYIRSDLQMKLYCLACREQLGIDIYSAGLYFVEHDRLEAFKITESWLEEGRSELRDTVAKIRTREYTPMPGSVCTRCEFRKICKFAKKRKK